MAGFGTILDKPIHDAYPDRDREHPPGAAARVQGLARGRDALAAGVKVTGCTVHLATLEVDDGPILAQEAVPVLDDDTEETLHERIKDVERRLYPDGAASSWSTTSERTMSADRARCCRSTTRPAWSTSPRGLARARRRAGVVGRHRAGRSPRPASR